MNIDVFTTMPAPVKTRQDVVTAIPDPDPHPPAAGSSPGISKIA